MDATDLLKSTYSIPALILGAISYILFSDVIKTAVDGLLITEKVFLTLAVFFVFLVVFSTLDGGGGDV